LNGIAEPGGVGRRLLWPLLFLLAKQSNSDMHIWGISSPSGNYGRLTEGQVATSDTDSSRGRCLKQSTNITFQIDSLVKECCLCP
jgi:hypothetical protein